MTQDMLRGLNQLINKVAAAVPTNMRAPQPTVHDGLTQQAQTALHQQLSSGQQTTKNSTNAENLALSLQGRQLIIRLPVVTSKEAQTSAQQTTVSIPLTDDQVKLIKSLLAQQTNARNTATQASTLTVSIEALTNTQALANTSIKIPAEQRTQIALALLVQANQLAISGQIQGANKPLANLLSLFVAPLDKVVNVPLQRVPNTLQTIVDNLNTSNAQVTANKQPPILTIESQPIKQTSELTSNSSASRLADVQIALNKHVIAGTLNTQHVATQTFLKAVNQLHGGKLSLPTQELSAIVQRINSPESKAFLQALVSPKSLLSLAPQLDKLSMSLVSPDRFSGSINTTNQARETNILRLTTPNKITDIALPNELIKPLNQLLAQSKLTSSAPTTDSASILQASTRTNQAVRPLLQTQALSTETIRALMPLSPNQLSTGQVPSLAQSVVPIINQIVTANTAASASPNSEQLLAEVQELTQTDLASLVLHKVTQRQPHNSSPQSTLLSGLATMVQISLASKLQQQLSGGGNASVSAKNVAIEQQLNGLIAPHIASLAVQQSTSKTSESSHDPATELLRGITRLLTNHRMHQAVSLEWQAQHPDSQYFTLPNFLSGSKQPIQLLIKQEQQTDSEHSDRVEHQGNKWHISLQFDIPNKNNAPKNNTDTSPQGTLLVKATLQAQTVNIALYGSTETLLDNINQHKHVLEQRLRQLGFTVDAQPAYQGVINDSLVEWPKSIRPSNEVSV